MNNPTKIITATLSGPGRRHSFTGTIKEVRDHINKKWLKKLTADDKIEITN